VEPAHVRLSVQQLYRVEIREFHRDINRKSKYRGSPWVTHEGTSSDQVLAILKRVLRTERWPSVPIDNSISRVDYGAFEFSAQACHADDMNSLQCRAHFDMELLEPEHVLNVFSERWNSHPIITSA
jgi:hypothetical protein